jgi:tripartite-type tricarboxylate transporter receptor subunit TctC
MFAPGTTPKSLVARLNGAVNKIIATADTQAEFRKDGLEPSGNTPEEFSALIGSEVAKWAKVIKAAGI